MPEIVRNPNILSTVPIPEMYPSQIEAYTPSSLRVRETGVLDPMHAIGVLKENRGREMLVFDFGATAMKYCIAQISSDGSIALDKSRSYAIENEGEGRNYMDGLIQASKQFPHLPTAVSTAGIVENNELVESPNLPTFVEDLRKAGGFSKVLGMKVPVMNDGQAGLIAAAVGVASKYNCIKPVIFLINGGGIGGAIMDANGVLYATEPGHIPVISELNPFGVTRACEVDGSQSVCLERVGASGEGIEQQWEDTYGQKLDGKSIAEKMYSGDIYALRLIDNATQITAHAIAGMAYAMRIPLPELSIVLHGGFFNTVGAIDRIGQILKKQYGDKIDLIPTQELGFSNACMTGLAIAAASTRDR